jgi:hypothetical protein
MNTTPPETDDELDGFNYDEPPVVDGEIIYYEEAVRSAEYLAYWQQRITEAGDAYDAEEARLQARIDALHERRAHEVGKLTGKYEYHRARVLNYHQHLLESEPGRKSVDLIYGTSNVRVYKKPRLKIDDRAAVLAWAKERHPELVTYTERISQPELESVLEVGDSKVFDPVTGEAVPGVSSHVSEPTFWFDRDPNGAW